MGDVHISKESIKLKGNAFDFLRNQSESQDQAAEQPKKWKRSILAVDWLKIDF